MNYLLLDQTNNSYSFLSSKHPDKLFSPCSFFSSFLLIVEINNYFVQTILIMTPSG